MSATNELVNLGDRILDRYRIEEKIAAGGHGHVFRATDERLARSVCVKVFHRRTYSDGVTKMRHEHFVQEAFTLSKLSHPNTLRIYDFGYLSSDEEGDGAPFQVSELMNGGTLTRVIRKRGPMTRAEARTVLLALCGALEEAHAAGITHRDIKPQNILFHNTGTTRTVKLADFGFAKFSPNDGLAWEFQAGDTAVTAGESIVMMSPSWAAPEQMRGLSVGPYTDIYSLGLIVAYVLTGRGLFTARSVEEGLLHRENGDARIDEVLADGVVSPAVVALLKRACAYLPEDRPKRIEDLAAELDQALGDPTPPPVLAIVEGTPQPRAETPNVRLSLRSPPAALGDRTMGFVPIVDGGAIVDGSGVRARVSFVRAGNGSLVHLKGLSCFVALSGARASTAANVSATGFVDFVMPDGEVVARAQVVRSRTAAGHRLLEVAGHGISINAAECREIAALDFGPQSGCYLIYEPAPGLEPDVGSPRRSR